jgi:hypothetical protein
VFGGLGCRYSEIAGVAFTSLWKPWWVPAGSASLNPPPRKCRTSESDRSGGSGASGSTFELVNTRTLGDNH